MRSCLRGVGEALVTLAMLVFLFMAYMYWGTALRAGSAQRGLAGELNRQWHAPALAAAGLPRAGLPGSHLALGQPFAFIRVPAFGRHWRFAVVQGTGLAQLALGPGHVPGTQFPGQLGNFAVAGHRVTAGNPFWSLPDLRRGNLVLIDTAAATYTYRVTGRPYLTSPAASAVLDPVPWRPGARPDMRLITLITCDPAWTGTHRVIVTGVLVRVAPRAGSAAARRAGSDRGTG